MTSELRAEPGEAWIQDEGRRADDGQGAQVVHSGRHRRAPEARSSYREVFAIGEFRALWSAQVLSFAGDQLAQVAIAIWSWPECGAARRRPGPAGPGPRCGLSPRTASGSSSVAACY